MITEFLSGINVWLAVVLVDGAIGIVLYAGYIAFLNLKYSIEVFYGALNPEDYSEKGDYFDGEDRY